jgi:cytoskeletal protein CcmA (bactofilin family)
MTVSTTGTVEGKVRVAAIECDGQLAGEIDAERIELAGAVKENTTIRATTIQMKLADKGGKKQIVFGNSAGAASGTESTRSEGATESSDSSKGKRDTSGPEAEAASKKGDSASERSGSSPPKRRGSQSPPPAD